MRHLPHISSTLHTRWSNKKCGHFERNVLRHCQNQSIDRWKQQTRSLDIKRAKKYICFFLAETTTRADNKKKINLTQDLLVILRDSTLNLELIRNCKKWRMFAQINDKHKINNMIFFVIRDEKNIHSFKVKFSRRFFPRKMRSVERKN